MKRIKNLFLLAIITFGLGVGSINAVDNRAANDEAVNNTEVKAEQPQPGDSIKTEADNKADRADKSKAGEAISSTGSLAKSGAQNVGDAAKWSGRKVADGATWSYDKVKHNKLTKNVFNQPDDN